MPIIRSISDLSNHSNRITELARQNAQPVYITKNGEGDLVLLSIETFAAMERQADITARLLATLAQFAAGDRGRPLAEVLNQLRQEVSDQE